MIKIYNTALDLLGIKKKSIDPSYRNGARGHDVCQKHCVAGEEPVLDVRKAMKMYLGVYSKQ